MFSPVGLPGRRRAGERQLVVPPRVASAKMNAAILELVAILCNGLVCLALWMSGQTSNGAAK
jgi:formate/nitrite transporter FocA (FNT family)